MKRPDRPFSSTGLLAVATAVLVPTLAARLSRSGSKAIYKGVARRDPPVNPASRDVDWREALIWAGLTGLVAGMARLGARRLLPSLGLPAEGHGLDDAKKDALGTD